MGEVDKRGKLEEEPFSNKVSKDIKGFLYWHEKLVMILNEKDRSKFLTRLENANPKDAQLIMAKVISPNPTRKGLAISLRFRLASRQ